MKTARTQRHGTIFAKLQAYRNIFHQVQEDRFEFASQSDSFHEKNNADHQI